MWMTPWKWTAVADGRLKRDEQVVVNKIWFQVRVMRWFSVLERKDRVETGAMRIVLWTVPEVLRAGSPTLMHLRKVWWAGTTLVHGQGYHFSNRWLRERRLRPAPPLRWIRPSPACAMTVVRSEQVQSGTHAIR
jgi:hypothetical protein